MGFFTDTIWIVGPLGQAITWLQELSFLNWFSIFYCTIIIFQRSQSHSGRNQRYSFHCLFGRPKGPQGVYLGAVFIIRDGMKRFAPILYYDFPIIIGLVAHLLLLLSNPVAILSFRILHDKIHLFFFHAGFFLLEKSYYYIPG